MPQRQRALLILMAAASIGLKAGAQAATSTTAAPAAAKAYTMPRHEALTAEFEDFLSIPDVAADPEGLKKNADFLVAQLKSVGAETKLLTAPGLENVPPVVWGEVKTPGTARTIVFYAHYDGQPVTPSEWTNGKPFTPYLKTVDGEERVYARASGDDKAAIFAQLTALRAIQAAHLKLNSNVRFVWEGEEEAGSAHLEKILMANRGLIGGDIWLVCDGPVDQTREQSLAFGARGDTHMQITVYGPSRPLHSGHYGNWAPNPALELVQLLAGMKDANGRVLIPHFYDGIEPLGPVERKALAEAPVNDEMLGKELELGHFDGGGKHLLELLNEPTLNINGISAGQTGAHFTNSIPSSAVVNLDIRLVVGTDGKEEQQRVVDYVKAQNYFVTSAEPTREELLGHAKVARIELGGVEPAVRTPMDLPVAAEVIAAVKSARGKVVLLPTMGGTVPLKAMEDAAGTRTITVPIANHDDNQHAANENLRMQNMWDGVETMAALMAMQ